MNIIICSHPRAGTHLAIDLIRNNINGYELPYMSYHGVIKRNTRQLYMLRSRLENSRRVFKMHMLPGKLQVHDNALQLTYDTISRNSLFVYVYRDRKSVV